MTPEERRRLLGDDAIAECRRIAATATWPPELIEGLKAVARRIAADRRDPGADRAA